LNSLPLEGVRVADFTWIGAGSFTTKLLADHGAEVIKIESKERMDSLRNSRPYKDGVPGMNRSGYFADRNSSKRSITLNLKTEAGQNLARRLIAQSDIVANNFTPGTMEKFGLGYDAVREFKKDIIYIAMSMQGSICRDCPSASRPAPGRTSRTTFQTPATRLSRYWLRFATIAGPEKGSTSTSPRPSRPSP
jgi:benzylsuccinate CoA-transferase BbsF subunit